MYNPKISLKIEKLPIFAYVSPTFNKVSFLLYHFSFSLRKYLLLLGMSMNEPKLEARAQLK